MRTYTLLRNVGFVYQKTVGFMAIYHLHVQLIKRSQGENAVAASSYRRASKLYDQRAQRFWDFTHKPHVIHSELQVPHDAPRWVQACLEAHADHPAAAAELIWNQLEACEKRVDARLAREIEFALPIELTAAQSIALARAFITDQCVSLGMIADWSVHAEEGNPHVHVLLTLRSLTEAGFGHKVRAWDSKAQLQTWREQWAEYANFHLHLHQHAVRIDHRSYAAQGIDLIPGVHEGKVARERARRGVVVPRIEAAAHIRQLNLARISERAEIIFQRLQGSRDTFTDQDISRVLGQYVCPKTPASLAETLPVALPFAEFEARFVQTVNPLHAAIEKALQSLSQHESVFQESHFERAFAQAIESPDLVVKAMVAVKSHPDLIALGPGEDGRDRFTTRALLKQEHAIQDLADRLQDRTHLAIPASQQHTLLQQHQAQTGQTLTDEQKSAVLHLLKPTALACVVGRAGTGKSFSLGAAKTVWEAQGLHVYGIALSGIAADGLQKSVGIASRTIESFTYRVQQGLLTLKERDVVVMDEAGMTDSLSMGTVLQIVAHAQAKLVLVGDPAQLQPVGPGATFRALVEQAGFAEIQTIYRQSTPWQRQATLALASDDTAAQGLAAYQVAGCIHLAKDPEQAMTQLVAQWKQRADDPQKEVSQMVVIAHRNEDVDTLNQRIRKEQVRTACLSEGYAVETDRGKLLLATGDRILFLKNDSHLGVSNGQFATVTGVDFRESGQARQLTVQLDGSTPTLRLDPLAYPHFTYGYAATVHKTQGMTVDTCLVYAGGTRWNRSLTYVALSRHRHHCHVYADEATHTDAKTLFHRLSRRSGKESVLDFPLAFAARRGIDPRADRITQRREDARLVAQYVDAQRAVGMAWEALQTKLQKLGIPALDYSDPSFDVVKGTTAYQALQAGKKARNRAADQILTHYPRYEAALRLYDLDSANLQKQALQHRAYQTVQRYCTHRLTGFSVYRDYEARTIQRDMKTHYPALREWGIHTREPRATLRTEALAYVRRAIFLQCSPEAQKSFACVAAYQAAHRHATQFWWNAIQSTPQPHPDVLKSLEALHARRNECAADVLTRLAEREKALDFYQIGKATAHWGEPLLEKDHAKAQKRWYQLQQHAAYHQIQARVFAYQRACEQSDVKSRLSLAYDIVQDPKAHHGAVVRLVGQEDLPLFWHIIRHDAKRQKDWRFYRTLDAVDRLGFQTVQRYVEAKERAKALWRSFFADGERAGRKGLPLAEQIAHDTGQRIPAARELHLVCQALAQTLLENPALYQAGLNYFQIEQEELDRAATQHHCHLRVQQYQNTPLRLARAEIASQIMADYPAHAGAIQQNQLDVRLIRHDARIAERRQHFATLTADEKFLARLVDRYRHANQAVGKGYAKSLSQPPSPQRQAQLNRRFAQRDALAWRLVQTVDPDSLSLFADVHRLNPSKLLSQQARFSECCTRVEQYQRNYQVAMAALQTVDAVKDEKATLAQTIPQALKAIDAVMLKPLVNSFHRVLLTRYVLPRYGLSEQKIIQQKRGLIERKTTLKAYAAQQNIGLKPAVKPVRVDPMRVTRHPDIRRDTQRLRADLNARAENVAIHYLGQPKTRHGHAWRYGRHQGSLVVQVSGPRQGLWHDFQLGKGGDMLNLIQHVSGLADFKTVLAEATRFLGGSSAFVQTTSTQSPPVKSIDIDAHTQQRIAKAQAIARQTQSIAGTLAERYCREHRGIAGKMDETHVRYHPHLKNWMTRSNHPALVILARDVQQQVCGVHAIFLDATTANKASDLGHHVKLSRGLMGEGAILQQGKHGGTIALAEGPETALSIAQAKPDWTVIVAFGVGNFKSVRLPEWAKMLVICADHDEAHASTHKTVTQAVQQWTQRGLAVSVVEPQKPVHQKKWDFNDVLRTQGVAAVRVELDRIGLNKMPVNPQKTISRCDTPDHMTMVSEYASIDKSSVDGKHESLETLLGRYVDMELEQSRLLSEMYSARLQDPTTYHPFAERMITHNKALDAFAQQVVEHPEMKMLGEAQRHGKPRKLTDCGGFIGIHERVQSGSWSTEDVQTVIGQVRQKAARASPVQVRERDRGGRGR